MYTLGALALRSFSQGLLENALHRAIEILDFSTILKICYRSSLVYFGIKKTAESGFWLEDLAERTNGAESLGGAKDSLSLSYLLGIKKMTQE